MAQYMLDKKTVDTPFIPFTKDQLKSAVDSFIGKLKSQNSEEVIAVVTELGFIEQDIKRYIEMGPEKRAQDYTGMLAETADRDYMQYFQIRYLVLLSLPDSDLQKILDTIPESRAREHGFKSSEHKKEWAERLLVIYLQLCKHYYNSAMYHVSWKDLVTHENLWSIMRDFCYPEPDGSFTDSTMQYFREQLMDCRASDFDKVEASIKFAEQNLINYIYIQTVPDES